MLSRTQSQQCVWRESDSWAKLKQASFWLDIRTDRHWSERLCTLQMLSISKTRMHAAQSNLTWSFCWCCFGLEVGLEIPWGPFQSEAMLIWKSCFALSPEHRQNYFSVKPCTWDYVYTAQDKCLDFSVLVQWYISSSTDNSFPTYFLRCKKHALFAKNSLSLT